MQKKYTRLLYDLVFRIFFSKSSLSEKPRRRSAPAAATIVTSTPAAAQDPATVTST